MKILIVRTGAMGDILHAMPGVTALRQALPDAEIGWVIEPRWLPLLQSAGGDMPLVHRIHLAATKSWSKHPFSLSTLQSIRSLRAELRSVHYDVAMDVQGLIRSALIGRFAHAASFYGFAHPKESLAARFYTQRIATYAPHVVQQVATLVGAATGQSLHAESEVQLPIDTDAEEWAESFLSASTQPIVLLAPQAGWGAKQWPAENFGVVASALAQQGIRVLVNTVPGGDVLSSQVIAASHNQAQPVEATLPQLIALMRRVQLFLGGDTGPLHLAAALRIPTVALFGPTDPARNGPWANRSIVLRNPASHTDHSRHAQTEAGLAQITTQQVLLAANTLLQETIET